MKTSPERFALKVAESPHDKASVSGRLPRRSAELETASDTPWKFRKLVDDGRFERFLIDAVVVFHIRTEIQVRVIVGFDQFAP